VAQLVAVKTERVTVRGRVVDEEDHALHAAISLLERNSALDRLHIPESRLDFNRCGPRIKNEDEIPRSTVANDPERRLRNRSDRLRTQHAKSPDKRQLSRSANRISRRKRSCSELEPDGSGCQGKLLDRDAT